MITKYSAGQCLIAKEDCAKQLLKTNNKSLDCYVLIIMQQEDVQKHITEAAR